MERRLAAIMFSDIVGYTALMSRDESAGLRVRERHRSLLGGLVAQYGGALVDENGDELVVSFESAVDAVNCALRAQQQVASDAELVLRVGIHLGDIVVEAGRVYGDSVNLASRVRALAEPRGICVSAEVWQAVRSQANVEFRELGTHDLKNVGRPMQLYSVSGTAAEPAAIRRPRPTSASRSALLRRATLVLLLVGLAVGAWWLLRPAAPLPSVRSLAVLPLENLSGDPDQEFFADGMTDSLIADLARISSLRVTSRTSVMKYKGTRTPLPEIGAALNVDALLEGSVMREGNRVRVTAQLIDARTDAHLWADQYERDLTGILALQSEIASAIARRVNAQLTPKQERRFSARPPAVPAAHDAYLKGLYFAQKHTPAASLRARDHFQDGMKIDPLYPLPYAGLADTLSCSPMHTWVVPAEGAAAVPQALMEQALELANRAIELDQDLPEAQTALGLVEIFRDLDWASAERRFQLAIDLNPSYEFAYRSYALMLAYQRRFPEAVEKIERARELDPFGAFVASLAGDVYWFSGDSDKALALWREASELDAGHPIGAQRTGTVLCQRGQVDASLPFFAEARRLSSDDPLVVGDLAFCLASAGQQEEARALLRELEERSAETWVDPIALGLIHLALGERDAALSELERAYELRSFRLIEVAVDERWDPVRSDPRYRAILHGIGLAQS